MSHPLDGCRLKLAWADAHFHALEARIRELLGPDPDCIPREFDFQRHQDVFRAQRSIDIPPDLSLIIGDTVRNLSAALDYLVWELVGGDPAAGGRGATSTGFPIFVDPGSYEARALKKIRGIPPSAEAVIKRLQPFERSDFPETDPLALLYVLEQRDKHRTLNLTTIMGSVYITEGGVRADDLGGVQFAFGPVEQDAVICHARRGVLNRHMEVYLHVAYYVAFDYEWPVGGRNILELLDEIRRDIRVNVLPLFDQFFPLP